MTNPNSKPKILIIDDERNIREGLRKALSSEYQVILAENGARGLDIIYEYGIDVVITDLRMPEMDGMEFLRRIHTMENPPACIMVTAYGNIPTAIEAVRAGAETFLEKPVDLNKLELAIKQALEKRALKQENQELKRELANKYALENIIASSPKMKEIMEVVQQVAPTRSSVLITGENGTGKEMIARAIHRLSNRAHKPFVAIHCAALNPNLLESELFGHEKGAYTGATERRIGRFESADGGTVFLDEISEIDASIQVKLLRVLETRTIERVGSNTPIPVDIRLISATNQNLEKMISEGKFREDLYYRLNVIRIHLPPLRERKEDIPLLIHFYIKQFSREMGKTIESITPEALHILESYSWPGNVRELRNCVERMVVFVKDNKITVREIPPDIRQQVESCRSLTQQLVKETLDLKDTERILIQEALQKSNGNRTRAAELLGISRRTLHRKLKQFHLE